MIDRETKKTRLPNLLYKSNHIHIAVWECVYRYSHVFYMPTNKIPFTQGGVAKNGWLCRRQKDTICPTGNINNKQSKMNLKKGEQLKDPVIWKSKEICRRRHETSVEIVFSRSGRMGVMVISFLTGKLLHDVITFEYLMNVDHVQCSWQCERKWSPIVFFSFLPRSLTKYNVNGHSHVTWSWRHYVI